jgi:hypothetical protein
MDHRGICALWRILHNAHIRRYFVRAGDANPAQLACWTAAWLERIKVLYAVHAQLTAAWEDAAAPREAPAAAARLEEAAAAWDEALAVIDEARKKQMAAPPAAAGEEGARHPGPGMGRPGRAPRLPDDRPR